MNPCASHSGVGGHSVAERYLHEVGFYDSDEAFRSLICPFALDGVAAREPVVFAYDPRKTDLLHDWLPDSPSISYVTDTEPYAAPAEPSSPGAS